MDVFPKFIIEDCNLVIGKVTYHRKLAENIDDVVSGGWFRYEESTNTFVLHGTSDQFGTATMEQIKDCIDKDQVFLSYIGGHNVIDRHNVAYDTQSEVIQLAKSRKS